MSDEAHFELPGCVNKQNMRYWSEANPYEPHLKPLHIQKVTVWCGMVLIFLRMKLAVWLLL
jgi:hypothetical protein